MPRVVLASASPARLGLLRSAGVEPVVLVSDVDEDALIAAMPATPPEALVLALARAKATAVAQRLRADGEPADLIVIGCDSMLEVDGRVFGKPADAAEARERWLSWIGRPGTLHTGHWVIRLVGDVHSGAVGSTVVHAGSPSEREIDAYIATGEPLAVAGGFTLDGLGAPFVDRIEGDPSNVIGLSLPLLRTLLLDLGVVWTDLWGRAPG